MSPDEKKLQKLSSLAKKLNSESDGFNKSIENIEQKLADMKLGVSVWLMPLFDISGPHTEYDEKGDRTRSFSGYQLGYSKVGDTWRISARKAEVEEGDAGYEIYPDQVLWSDNAVALTNAPRVVRTEAAEYLDSLIDTLIRQTEAYLKNIETAKGLADNETMIVGRGRRRAPYSMDYTRAVKARLE